VTEDGRAVKLLYAVDEFTREALAMEAERRIDGDRVVDVLEGSSPSKVAGQSSFAATTGRR
jgi:hypothetical protein